jgi:hypothetical protein
MYMRILKSNHLQVACTQAAADAWAAADCAQQAAAAAEAVAAQRSQPKGRPRRPPQQWVDLGSEAELAAVARPPPPAPICLVLERPLRDFVAQSQAAAAPAVAAASAAAGATTAPGAATASAAGVAAGEGAAPEAPPPPVRLTDVGASDLWNSAQNECRPFKDPNYDLRRARREGGVQAVPQLVERGVQVGAWLRC